MCAYALNTLKVGVNDPSLCRVHRLHDILLAKALNLVHCLVCKILDDLLSVLSVAAYIKMNMNLILAVLISYEICKIGDGIQSLAVTSDSIAAVAAGDGIPVKVLQSLMGHAHYQTTADIYAHVNQRPRIEAARLISHTLIGARLEIV